jgi:hypothetical protein
MGRTEEVVRDNLVDHIHNDSQVLVCHLIQEGLRGVLISEIQLFDGSQRPWVDPSSFYKVKLLQLRFDP